MRSLFTWCSSCFPSLQHNLAVWATLPYKSTIKKNKKNPCFGHLFCGEGKGQRLPLLNPVMSSMTSVPHRIGGTRHKFPENSPFLPTLAAPWWTSCCKKKSFSSTSNVKHRDKSHSIYIPTLFYKKKPKKKPNNLRFFLGFDETKRSESWRWWGRRSRFSSSSWMRLRTESWTFRRSSKLNVACVKLWEMISHYCFTELKSPLTCSFGLCRGLIGFNTKALVIGLQATLKNAEMKYLKLWLKYFITFIFTVGKYIAYIFFWFQISRL